LEKRERLPAGALELLREQHSLPAGKSELVLARE
jgi:hypothetical protein